MLSVYGSILDPALAIEALGRSMRLQVITISLGKEEQLKEATRTIRNSLKKNSREWIVFQNCHLENSWSQDFFRLVEVGESSL